MAKRSQQGVSEAHEGRSERPATGYGSPEAGLGELMHEIARRRFALI